MAFAVGERGRYRGAEASLMVYDLSPANGCLHAVGLGLYHTGLRIGSEEWTFSDSGVFSHRYGDVPGATLRCMVPLGDLSVDARAVARSISELKSSGGYSAGSYHLMFRNCNHFSAALCAHLQLPPPPGWVNRLADICSYIPAAILPDSSGGGGAVNGGESQSLLRGRQINTFSAFAGTGQSLVSAGSSSSTSISSKTGSDSADRRQQMAAVALARAAQATATAAAESSTDTMKKYA